MLLSDWYANWKEKRIQAAVEAAKAKGYEDGYADGLSGTPNLKGIRQTRSKHTRDTPREGKSHTEK
jgi:hypothetical protein